MAQETKTDEIRLEQVFCKSEPEEHGESTQMSNHVEILVKEELIIEPEEMQLSEQPEAFLWPKSDVRIQRKLCNEEQVASPKLFNPLRCSFCFEVRIEKQICPESTDDESFKKLAEFVLARQLDLSYFRCCVICYRTLEQFSVFKQTCLESLDRSLELWKVELDSKDEEPQPNSFETGETEFNAKCLSSDHHLAGRSINADKANEVSESGSQPSSDIEKKESRKRKRSYKIKKTYTCEICSKKVQLRRKDVHLNKHNGIKSIPCSNEGCDKMFLGYIERNRHKSQCQMKSVKEYTCPHCGKVLRGSGSYNDHLQLHSDVFYDCEVCGKKFKTKDRVLKHRYYVHSEERKFECQVCQKRFKSRESCRVHQRTHSVERPYQCTACEKQFKHNRSLKAHFESNHGSK
ncbi:zinc finger protein 510-like [Uranotaenia lowii]|uniref:zinc finger protein 510-like n=1 Tax=Uranotaenia lowii TaxID=190385 RepID=UPI00247AAA95|nr:zinc finger protein 510-like [Uranotaenia lowii]